MAANGHRAKQIAVFSVLAVCVVTFIFWNSLQNVQASDELSGGLLAFLKPLLLPLFGGTEEGMHTFIRKAAHFAEFAALGLCLCGIADGIRIDFWRTSVLFFPLFTLWSVAVTDEFIQSLSDRSGEVRDVILDFSGGVFGVAIMAVVFAIVRHHRKREV